MAAASRASSPLQLLSVTCSRRMVSAGLTLGSADVTLVPQISTFCTNFHAAALIPLLTGRTFGSSTNDRIRRFEPIKASYIA